MPGRWFSINTSARAMSRRATSSPPSNLRSNATPRLLRLSIMNAADSPSKSGGRKPRVASPSVTGSTLITSAPMSASIRPHVGPAMMCANSTTRRPVSGPPRLGGLIALLTLEPRVASLQKSLDALPVIIGLKRLIRLLPLISRERAASAH